MKKVGIYLERKTDSGGAYQYCLAMLRALSKIPDNEFEITAFCTYKEWKQVTDSMGIRTIVVKKNIFQKILHLIAEKLLSIKMYRKLSYFIHPLARMLKRESVDVCIYPCGDKISFMLETPAIVTVFDLMHRYLKEFPEIVEKKIYSSREKNYTNIVKYAKLIFVDSNVGKRHVIECYGNDCKIKSELIKKTKVLPMIAPDYVYDNVGKVRGRKKSKFEKYIFYPAQFWKHKNHKNLLIAISELRNEGIIVNLSLCGSNKNAYEDVLQIIDNYELHEQVEILGYITNGEMISLYQYATALIMPTFGGPTNIPQLEAFVLGCPVATSDIFGIPEQVEQAALLFDPNSVKELKTCIKKLWTDEKLCKDLIEKGYQRAEEWGEEQYKERLIKYLQ